MKRPFEFSVSLRATHPSWTAAEICARFQRVARFSWNVGERRATPKGTLLEGYRKDSYCCFDSGEGDDGELADCLRAEIVQLRTRYPDIEQFNATGGRMMFYVFWYPNGDTGEEFDVDLLKAMAELKIVLGMNVYDDRPKDDCIEAS